MMRVAEHFKFVSNTPGRSWNVFSSEFRRYVHSFAEINPRPDEMLVLDGSLAISRPASHYGVSGVRSSAPRDPEINIRGFIDGAAKIGTGVLWRANQFVKVEFEAFYTVDDSELQIVIQKVLR